MWLTICKWWRRFDALCTGAPRPYEDEMEGAVEHVGQHIAFEALLNTAIASAEFRSTLICLPRTVAERQTYCLDMQERMMKSYPQFAFKIRLHGDTATIDIIPVIARPTSNVVDDS